MPTTLFYTDVAGNESVARVLLYLCTVSSSERPACPQRPLRCRQELETVHVYECSLEEARQDQLMEAG